MTEQERLDNRRLLEVLSDFAHTLARRFEVSEVLYRLADNVVAILGVAGAGVSVVDEHGRLRPVTAVNELTRQLEQREEKNQQGPCRQLPPGRGHPGPPARRSRGRVAGVERRGEAARRRGRPRDPSAGRGSD